MFGDKTLSLTTVFVFSSRLSAMNQRKAKKRLLTSEQREQSQYIKDKANNTQGGRLTGADIQAYIVKEFGQHYHSNSIYYLLDHMGFSWITSRSPPNNLN
ncbi:helix-turn-helix domain-containing protein [Vibrio parahaemolyticus]|uniref:helix-turn-helix domain-containing protein n=3 Tax=Vibrio parahaemolyticus TaxID=670 RepID=UPI001F52AA57|nr:winged helix-turn-helix domain-containing protein [Vibrio parahaemolyticus]